MSERKVAVSCENTNGTGNGYTSPLCIKDTHTCRVKTLSLMRYEEFPRTPLPWDGESFTAARSSGCGGDSSALHTEARTVGVEFSCGIKNLSHMRARRRDSVLSMYGA